jgi:hypothetical protein
MGWTGPLPLSTLGVGAGMRTTVSARLPIRDSGKQVKEQVNRATRPLSALAVSAMATSLAVSPESNHQQILGPQGRGAGLTCDMGA